MTDADPRRPDRVSLSLVIDAAMGLLDADGWSAVTLRAVARRMGVQPTSVVFQVKSKERMRELMADRVFGELSLLDTPADPGERVLEICHRLRRALLAHRDGAALVTGTTVWEQNTLAVTEEVLAALVQGGATRHSALQAALCVEYLVLGLVQEEQATHSSDEPAYDPEPERHPALASVTPLLAEVGFVERLDFGTRAIIGFALPTSSAPPPASPPERN